MLQTLFRKKKYTEDTLANVFVNNLVASVDASFEDVANLLKTDNFWARNERRLHLVYVEYYVDLVDFCLSLVTQSHNLNFYLTTLLLVG